jgi:hypothetical protein
MHAHLAAVRAALEASGWDVYLVDAVKRDAQGQVVPLVYPYYLVWPSAGAPHAEADLARSRTFSFLVGVTSVGLTADSAGVLARNARTTFGGGERYVPLAVAGRSARIRWESFSTSAVDRDVSLNGLHPVTWVDLYRIASAPA